MQTSYCMNMQADVGLCWVHCINVQADLVFAGCTAWMCRLMWVFAGCTTWMSRLFWVFAGCTAWMYRPIWVFAGCTAWMCRPIWVFAGCTAWMCRLIWVFAGCTAWMSRLIWVFAVCTACMCRLIWVFAGNTSFCWFCHVADHFFLNISVAESTLATQVWENTVDPNNSLISVYMYTVCHSVCIFWTHYSMVKLHCSNFRIITAIFLDVQNFQILSYLTHLCLASNFGT